MTKISVYPILTTPTEEDILIGTDVNSSDETKNFSIGSIINLIGDINQGPPGPQGPQGTPGSNGATNLTTVQTQSNFTINSDTGTDAVVPLGNGTFAGATSNDYTTAEKNKLEGIQAGAEVNVNADWNSTSGDAQILNKPTIPDAQIQSDWEQLNAGSLDYIKNKPAIPAAQVNSNWNSTSGISEILNKPTIPDAQIQSDWTQANTSALDYIKNKPGIPGVQDLQATVTAGRTVTDGSTTLSVYADSIKVDDALGGGIEIVSTYATNPYLKFKAPSSGGRTVTLTLTDSKTGSRIIKLPDAEGIIPLKVNGYEANSAGEITIPTGTGGVTSVSGTGTVSGLTLTGTVISSGDITLGGTLALTNTDVTSGLGFTPYNATNPAGYTSYAEPGIFSGGGTPTLASGVTAAEIRTLIGAGTPIDDADFVKNTSDTYTPSAKITQIVTLSQAQYDAIASPLTSTIYIII